MVAFTGSHRERERRQPDKRVPPHSATAVNGLVDDPVSAMSPCHAIAIFIACVQARHAQQRSGRRSWLLEEGSMACLVAVHRLDQGSEQRARHSGHVDGRRVLRLADFRPEPRLEVGAPALLQRVLGAQGRRRSRVRLTRRIRLGERSAWSASCSEVVSSVKWHIVLAGGTVQTMPCTPTAAWVVVAVRTTP